MKLLDLFCGAGGAAMGYHRAGFEVTGVDIRPQPHFPFAFVQADAFEYVAEHGHEYDVIHASPPCQGYSIMRNLPWLKDKEYPLLIALTRDLLNATGRLYVIENVAGARFGSRVLAQRGLQEHGLKAAWLCGAMFGLPFYRHRYFETNWFWMQPGHPRHQWTVRNGRKCGARARDLVHDGVAALAARTGQGAGVELRKWAMGIDWMTGDELSQAIPPAYTEWIGRRIVAAIGGEEQQ